ncbi:hypothetical protein [Christensenella intestinihominis]|uniref:hypothetical protein n=1 Tax=Christensenella intestinihominis TaxID=1851429 RepID=UPI0011C70206|nr:hypothetical protein [Christensenella intestinihominis]
MRKLSFVLCIVLVLSICSVGFAAEPAYSDANPPAPVFSPDAVQASSPEYSMNIVPYAITSVLDWSNGIGKASSTGVACTSFTRASAIADKIEVQYVLYQYNGGWKQYKSTTHSKTKSAAFTDGASFSVASGYSYYVTTYHRTYSGSTVVSSKSATSGSIYVS